MLSKDSRKKIVNIALCLHHRISTHINTHKQATASEYVEEERNRFSTSGRNGTFSGIHCGFGCLTDKLPRNFSKK